MTTTAPVQTVTLESLAKRVEELEKKAGRTYVLFYHYRYQRPLEKIFVVQGSLREAIEEGRRHCSEMDYRFIKVRPYIVDFREQEKRKHEDPLFEEDN